MLRNVVSSRFVLTIVIAGISPVLSADQTGEGGTLRCEPVTDNALGDFYPTPSPDGNHLVFVRKTDRYPGSHGLFHMPLNGPGQPREILSPREYDSYVSWSPNGQWIGYTATVRPPGKRVYTVLGNSVYKLSLQTGEKTRIIGPDELQGIEESVAWVNGEELLVVTSRAFFSVNADTGTPSKVADLPESWSMNDRLEQFAPSPDGKSVAFSVESPDGDQVTDRSGIWLLDLDKQRIRQLTSQASDIFPTWLDSGRLLFQRHSEQDENGFVAEALHVLSVSTGTVELNVGYDGVLYSMGKSPGDDFLYAATASEWSELGGWDDWFRGFSISRCVIER